VLFYNGEYHLVGLVHKTERSKLWVVFCHGFMGNKAEVHRMFVKCARCLAEAGITSLRFDFRGCGDSGGESSEFGISDWISDVGRALDFIQSNYGAEEFALIGLSFGGGIASTVAERDFRIRYIVLWAPVADFADALCYSMGEEEAGRIFAANDVDFYGNVLGQKFLKEAQSFRPIDELKNFSGDVLIIHGAGDGTVPPSHGKEYAEKFAKLGCAVEYYQIAQADHTFNNALWERDVVERTCEWLKMRVEGR